MLDLAQPHTEPLHQIQAHASTYHRFIVLIRFVVLAHVAAAAFFGLGFLTESSWLTSAVVAGVVLVAGIWLERRLDRAGRTLQADQLLHGQAPADASPAMGAALTAPTRAPARETTRAGSAEHYVVIALWFVAFVGWAAISLPSAIGIVAAALR